MIYEDPYLSPTCPPPLLQLCIKWYVYIVLIIHEDPYPAQTPPRVINLDYPTSKQTYLCMFILMIRKWGLRFFQSVILCFRQSQHSSVTKVCPQVWYFYWSNITLSRNPSITTDKYLLGLIDYFLNELL